MEGGRRKTKTWTSLEDQRLIAGVSKFGLDNWSHVAVSVGGGRTRAQCAQRWNRGLDPRISRKRWTPEEESKLLALIKNRGEKGWTFISNELGTRSDVQCRYHYLQMKKEGRIPPNYTDITPPNSTTEAVSKTLESKIHTNFTIPNQQPHSIDYLEATRFAYSPEPYISGDNTNFNPAPRSTTTLEQIKPQCEYNLMQTVSPQFEIQQQPTLQQQQHNSYGLFKIPPPNYETPAEEIFTEEKTEDDDEFSLKLPDCSDMYSLW